MRGQIEYGKYLDFYRFSNIPSISCIPLPPICIEFFPFKWVKRAYGGENSMESVKKMDDEVAISHSYLQLMNIDSKDHQQTDIEDSGSNVLCEM